MYRNPEEDEELELERLFADGIPAQGYGGGFVTLPSMPLLRQPHPREVSTGEEIAKGRVKQRATNETPEPPMEEIEEISIGDEVVLPKGVLPRGETRSRVQWISAKKQRIGVGKRKGGGYTFFSFAKFEKLSGRKIAEQILKQRKKDATEEGRPAQRDLPKLPSSINLPKGRTLFAHQLENVEFLWRKKRGIIADEMGLGKTASAIVSIEAPAVVVCPAHLKVNWARELAMWQPDLSVAVIEGKTGQRSYRYETKERKRRTSRPTTGQVEKLQQSADVIIINYEILASNLDWISRRPNRTLVADEAHYLKTMDIRWDNANRRHKLHSGAQRAKAFFELQQSIERLYLLTGTPLMNRVKELFPLLNMVNPREWGSQYRFCVRYCAPAFEWVIVKGGRGKQEEKMKCNGRSNSEELHEKIKGVTMMRHTKEAELADLPDKLRNVELVSLSPKWQAEYRNADQDFLRWLEEEGGFEAVSRAQMAEALVRLNKLREISAMGKVVPAIQWIAKFFESTGRPLVVFALHLKAIEAIEMGLQEVNRKVRSAKNEGRLPPISREIRVDKMIGGLTPSKRQQVVDRFQKEGKTDVLIYSIPIATGTTLTRAQDALFVERMWRPADEMQAEDRLHRIGQKNAVMITYMDAEGTIDREMAKLIAEKSEAFAAVIDGVDVSAFRAAQQTMADVIAKLPGFHELSPKSRQAMIEALGEQEGSLIEPNPYVDAYEEAARRGIAMDELLGRPSLVPNIHEDLSIFDEDGEWRDDFDL
jgi:hypothetical protein